MAGNATPITLNSILSEKNRDVPLLGESVIRRASLKMNRWKELRRRKTGGGFGSIARGGESLAARLLLTYSRYTERWLFDIYSDIRSCIWFIRDNSWAGLLLHCRSDAWTRQTSRMDAEGSCNGSDVGRRRLRGVFKGEHSAKSAPFHSGWGPSRERSVDRRVTSMAGDKIKERDKKCDSKRAGFGWVGYRFLSNCVLLWSLYLLANANSARELLSSLSQLTQVVSPAQLLPALLTRPGWSHILGRRILATPSPSIRGTLDPRRPHALHDNTTIQLRSTLARNGVNNISNGSLPHNTPSLVKTNTMPPPPSPQFNAPPPHILPISSPHSLSPVVTYNVPGRTHSPYLNPATPQPQQHHSYSSFSPMPQAMPAAPLVHNRAVQAMPPTGTYLRSGPGPGPSSLRQSLHQMPMGTQGSGVYGSPAGPGNNEYMWRL